MNRKWIAILLSAVLLLALAAACGKETVTNPPNDVNNMNSGTGDNQNNGTNPGGSTGNDLNGNGPSDSNTHLSGNTGDPVFPNSLATMDADVAVDDLIATLGLTETDLDNAMRDVSTVGDGVDGARTYRHKLLGHDSDVSYSFDDKHAINKVTVKTQKDYADDWRKEFNDTLRATAVEGKTDTWDYSDSSVRMSEDGDHFVITIEKHRA